MLKQVEESKIVNINKIQIKSKELVLSIDQNEKIIKFNEECELIFGYKKDEVLNRPFFDFLIPERYSRSWKNMFKSVKKNNLIDDFRLPLQTKNGHEIMVLWSSFPLKNVEGNVSDISLVGKLITSWHDAEEPVIEHPRIDLKTTENYPYIDKTIKNLIKKNLELENKNKKLEKEIKNLQSRRNKNKKREEDTSKTHGSIVGKSLYSLSDVVGGKKKREEIERITKELEERNNILNERDNQLINEKKSINERRNEFCKWREKLEILEEEINKREETLYNKEELFKNALLVSPYEVSSSVSPSIVTSEDIVDYPEFLNKISECAFIHQRGILKQVNDSFIDLLGYKNDEIIEKSIFDFIAPEGFPKVESYYLNRLKGDNISTYDTIFLTKDSNKIVVEISTRPTTFNGEKAEMAIIKKLKIN